MSARPGRKSMANQPASPLEDLVLVRIACAGGATRTAITWDLAPIAQHRFSPAELRAAVDTACALFVASGLCAENRGRLTASEDAAERARRFANMGSMAQPPEWDVVRNVHLVATALGLGSETSARKKALSHPNGLRTLILQKTYGLKGKKNVSAGKLRAQLAVVALRRAFGDQLASGLRKGSGMPSKMARTLAGQLARTPRDFATDAKLVAYLAAEAVGAVQTDADALRVAILRRMVWPRLDGADSSAQPVPVVRGATPETAPAGGRDTPVAEDARPAPPPHQRPGLPDFSEAVRRVAARSAQGWPGNRKAFISQVWEAIRAENAVWGLSEIEFKCMLTEAHRRGALVLANADLRNKDLRHEIERSATPDRNTIWHYVCVEE